MKTLSQIIKEAEERFDEKFEDVSIMLGGIWTTGELEIKDFLRTELETIVKESFKNTRVEEEDTFCSSGECKIPSYPICRHKVGKNDCILERESIQNQFLNN